MAIPIIGWVKINKVTASNPLQAKFLKVHVVNLCLADSFAATLKFLECKVWRNAAIGKRNIEFSLFVDTINAIKAISV